VKANNLIGIALITGLCAGLYACGGGGSSYNPMPNQPMQPQQPMTMTLTVNDVLMKSKAQSETDDPFNVNGGAVTVTPSNDEESDPVSIN
jgi:hypothetical protein